MNVRDFIYLDIERLKSIIAQAEGGLPTSREESKSNSKGISGKGEGDLFGFLKAQGGAEFIWENQETETKSLHDNIYNKVEEVLIENELLVNVSDFIEEKDLEREKYRNNLESNSFILTKGKVYINDFTKIKKIINKYNEIGEFIARCSTMSFLGDMSKEEIEKNKEFKRLKSDMEIPKWFKEGLDLFFKTFYKDRVEIKLTPFKNNPKFKFVGNLNKKFLRDDISNITYKYGTAPVSEWTIFGQITSIPPKERDNENVINNNTNIDQNPSDIRKALEQMFDSFRGIEELAQSVVYPEISITPIAIYRE
jgi:hypothetical protein